MDLVTLKLSPWEFYDKYLITNTPCLIDVGLTADWSASKDWKHENDNNVNFDFLSTSFGHLTVPVYNCKQRYYNSQVCEDMNFGEYLKYWQNVINSGHDYTKHECLYLKDWHFVLEVPQYKAYDVPDYFQDDWLNEFCLSSNQSDYRFVYMGPKNSSTPLHKDVFNSYSWSANIVGEKEWILIPPGSESRLVSDSNGKLPFDLEARLEESPELYKSLNVIKVTQKVGQIIFVPSGWIHQVKNTLDTISINHNWFNGSNVHKIWSEIKSALQDVQNELRDLKFEQNWDQECQNLLKIHFGMNFADFKKLIRDVQTRLVTEGQNSSRKNAQIQVIRDILASEDMSRFSETVS